MSDTNLVDGRDLPIVKLVPRTKHKATKKYYQRVEASLRAVGLIEPLIVFDRGDVYEILDGHLRHEILLGMGVRTIPCIICKTPPTNQEQSHE